MNDFVEFEGLSFYHHGYKPSPISKSKAFVKLQEKWNVPHDSDTTSVLPVPSTRFLDYDDSPVSPVRKDLASNSRIGSHSPVSVLEDFNSPKITTKSCFASHRVNKHHASVRFTLPFEKDEVAQWVCARYMGQTYRFIQPDPHSFANNEAATQIQRVVRGGLQRLHYKVQRLQYLLESSQEETDAAIAAIHKQTEERKQALRLELEEKARKEQKKIEEKAAWVSKSASIIEYLRKDNKKLRESNEKIYRDIQLLKQENDRLILANAQSDECLSSLAKHAESMEETNRKLLVLVPQYKAKVEEMEEAIQIRQSFIDFEHKVKTMYLKLMASIAEKVENEIGDTELAEEVVETALEMEERHLGMTLCGES